ncbi:unnamed protein product, partial [Staurois parvus]
MFAYLCVMCVKCADFTNRSLTQRLCLAITGCQRVITDRDPVIDSCSDFHMCPVPGNAKS